MDEVSSLPSTLPFGINFRSMGMKLIVVCALALFMTIPALFVGGLVQERTVRAADVVQEISGHVGGQQTFLGPTLAIPYTIPPQSPSDTAKHGMYLVFPATASAALKTATEERRRSLFKVPVFQADLNLNATFDLSGVPSSAPQGAVLDWSRAEFVVGVSDARGAQTDASVDSERKNLNPDARGNYAVPGYRGRKESAHQADSLRRQGRRHRQAKCTIRCNLCHALFRRSDGLPCWLTAIPLISRHRATGQAQDSMEDSCLLPGRSPVMASPRSGLCLSSPVACVPKEPATQSPVSTRLHSPFRSLKWQTLISP